MGEEEESGNRVMDGSGGRDIVGRREAGDVKMEEAEEAMSAMKEKKE